MLRLIIFLILSLYFGQGFAQNTDLKPCKNAEGKWGYCNSQGKVVIAQKYAAAQAFWENTYAIVKNQANFYNVVNTKGEEILPNYVVGAIGVQIFSKQLILTLYKSHSGREMYYRAHLPQHKEYAKEGFDVLNIDNRYITGKFDTDFADLNLIKIEGKNGLKGYINKKGEVSVPIKYNIWYDFSEGLVFFEKEREVFAAMDTTGKELFVLPEKMSYCPKGFSSGLALVFPNHKTAYYVDKSGKKVTDVFELELERGEGIGHFRGDIAPIYKNGKWRFFDKTGKLLPEEYELISNLDPHRDFTWQALGLIWVLQKDKKTGTILRGYVNGKGKVVVPIEHTYVFWETDETTKTSFIKAEKLDEKGAKLVGHYDKEGKIIKPFEVKK